MSSGRDSLGDLCKSWERPESDRRAPIGSPVYVRIDGNRFSQFTRGMARPFDPRMTVAMVETMKIIVDDFYAAVGYTQSDEISIVLYDPVNELPHGGRYQKLTSRFASKATAAFIRAATEADLGEFLDRRMPEFDARAFDVADLETAATILFWRQVDAIKNSVSMAARSFFSHRALQGKNQDDMLAMMRTEGIEDFFSHYPYTFTRGTWGRRVTEARMLDDDELARIPEAHRPIGPVERSSVKTFDIGSLRGVPDKVSVIFPAPVNPPTPQGPPSP